MNIKIRMKNDFIILDDINKNIVDKPKDWNIK